MSEGTNDKEKIMLLQRVRMNDNITKLFIVMYIHDGTDVVPEGYGWSNSVI